MKAHPADVPLPGLEHVAPRGLAFGTPRSPEEIREDRRLAHERKLVGQLRVLFGPGPPGATCGECARLVRVQYARSYLKCGLGPFSHGPGTDWRARWEACGKFSPRSDK